MKQYSTFQPASHSGNKQTVSDGIRKYWARVFVLGIFTFVLTRKDISIDVSMDALQLPDKLFQIDELTTVVDLDESSATEVRPMNTSLLLPAKSNEAEEQVKVSPKATPDNVANTYSNMHFTEKSGLTEAERKAKAAKRKKQLGYVKRFSKVAQKEMKSYGIPASITLAQGLLESNVGESKLATKNKNHFGIKCFSRSCHKGHCSNFTDDSHKDFFRIYKSAWDSYRSHSLLLKNNKRYAPLFELRSDDYVAWAKGLKKAGYATDKRYADKLIELIRDLKLYEYDD